MTTPVAVHPKVGAGRLPNIARAVLLPIIIGWLVALIFGLWIARLQYVELIALNAEGDHWSQWWIERLQHPQIDWAYPPDKIAAMFEERIDFELRKGPLLLFMQCGVMAGMMVWQTGLTARHRPDPIRYGGLVGMLVAAIQGVIAAAMHAPWTFVVPLLAVVIGVGLYAGWTAAPPTSVAVDQPK